MELNGLIAFTVILGTIGHVWCLCLKKTQTLHSHSCVHRTDAGSNLFKRDITLQPRHQVRHWYRKFSLYLNRMVKKKFSDKPSRGVAKAKKSEHKIKWNPNSAHKNQNLAALDWKGHGGGNEDVEWGEVQSKGHCQSHRDPCGYPE